MNSNSEENYKVCRYCDRKIGIEATFCWYCGRELVTKPERPEAKGKTTNNVLLIIGVFLFFLFVLVLFWVY